MPFSGCGLSKSTVSSKTGHNSSRRFPAFEYLESERILPFLSLIKTTHDGIYRIFLFLYKACSNDL